MDIFTGVEIERQIIKDIELELSRKLTDEEKLIASKAARKGIFKGKKYESGDMFVDQFNKRNYR